MFMYGRCFRAARPDEVATMKKIAFQLLGSWELLLLLEHSWYTQAVLRGLQQRYVPNEPKDVVSTKNIEKICPYKKCR